MIIGIGHDVCRIDRMAALLARFGDRIARKCLHAEEWPHFVAASDPAAFLAKRFAAKEAAAKALGTGIAAGVTLKDFIVYKQAGNGQPHLRLSGVAAALAARHGAYRAHISLTDESPLASAFVVIETLDQTPATLQG